MGRLSRFLGVAVLLFVALATPVVPPAAAAPEGSGIARPEGQMILAQTISIAPRWLDPADAEGIITRSSFTVRCTTRW